MIVSALLTPFLVTLQGLVSLWPSAGTVGATSDPLLVEYLRGMQGVVDIAGPLTFVVGLLTAVPALLAVRFAVWSWRLMPGKFS